VPIEIACPTCGRRLRAPDSAAGKRVKCPKCEAAIQVPARAQPLEQAGAAAQTEPPWYVQTEDGQKHGPMSKAQLDGWLHQRRLNSRCQVLQHGWPQWRWAEEIYPQLAGIDQGQAQAAPQEDSPFAGIGAQETPTVRARRAAAAESDEGGGVMGWVVFILIFGVGNLILYHTTGFVIIPIPRK